MNKNSWQETVKYVNSKLGKTFTLIDIEVDLNPISTVVLCGHRGTLLKLGYLRRLKKGLFKVVKTIPEGFRFLEAKQQAREKDLK